MSPLLAKLTVSPMGAEPKTRRRSRARHGSLRLRSRPWRKNPDPLLPITSYQGKTRTLDDWATVFNLAIVVLPDRPEGASFLPVVERIFATFGDSDVRTIVCVPTTPAIAKRILGADVDKWLVWCDPERAFVESLGLERLPAFVHLRLDTSLVSAAQGWSPSEWQKVADEIARHEHWTLADRLRARATRARPRAGRSPADRPARFGPRRRSASDLAQTWRM